MQKVIKNRVLRTTLIYVILTGLWISCSDWVLGLLVPDPKQIIVFSIVKGWLYIIVTGTILYFHISHDWEIHKQQDIEIRQAYNELEQRVQARTLDLQTVISELEAFSYSVSHDLRAPLRTIEGYDRLLQEDYAAKFNDKEIDYLHRIHEATQHMRKLIEALLQLSRVTRTVINYCDINLSRIAHEIIDENFSDRKNVIWDITPDMVIRADPILMRNVLMNLLGNAYKFTSHQDYASIKMGKVELDGRVWYFVRDNGVGFDLANSKHLFEPFQRQQKDFEGTGIGLASTKRIILRHRGEIKADAEVDKGATFYFYIGKEPLTIPNDN
jgi:signal transduction histidine kinase